MFVEQVKAPTVGGVAHRCDDVFSIIHADGVVTSVKPCSICSGFGRYNEWSNAYDLQRYSFNDDYLNPQNASTLVYKDFKPSICKSGGPSLWQRIKEWFR